MPFSKPFRQESIADRTWEWNVDDPSGMHMTDFSVPETEFTTSKAMWVEGDPGPRRYSVFEPFHWLHKTGLLHFWMAEQACSIHASGVAQFGQVLTIRIWRSTCPGTASSRHLDYFRISRDLGAIAEMAKAAHGSEFTFGQ